MIERIIREKVKIEELGLFIKLINIDNPGCTIKQLAELISSNFNVICTIKNIIEYEALHLEIEDLEKISRMMENENVEHLIE